jgi:hypothetical protein
VWGVTSRAKDRISYSQITFGLVFNRLAVRNSIRPWAQTAVRNSFLLYNCCLSSRENTPVSFGINGEKESSWIIFHETFSPLSPKKRRLSAEISVFFSISYFPAVGVRHEWMVDRWKEEDRKMKKYYLQSYNNSSSISLSKRALSTVPSWVFLRYRNSLFSLTMDRWWVNSLTSWFKRRYIM